MAKKKAEIRQIKLLLSPEDHRMVRLAAASRDQAMTEFVRATVMEAVSKELKGLDVAAKKTPKARRRTRPA
jgi:uncharacterized protein (DUF1778 family)